MGIQTAYWCSLSWLPCFLLTLSWSFLIFQGVLAWVPWKQSLWKRLMHRQFWGECHPRKVGTKGRQNKQTKGWRQLALNPLEFLRNLLKIFSDLLSKIQNEEVPIPLTRVLIFHYQQIMHTRMSKGSCNIPTGLAEKSRAGNRSL